MTHDGIPFIEAIGIDQRIPYSLQVDVDVWVHEFTEWSVKRILFDFGVNAWVKGGKAVAHYVASMVTTSGYLYGERVLKRQPENYHVTSQKTLDGFI